MFDWRDDLIDAVRYGHMSPEDADAEALRDGLRPLSYQPDPADFDNDATGHAEAVVYVDGEGVTRSQKASAVVLAANCVETRRIARATMVSVDPAGHLGVTPVLPSTTLQAIVACGGAKM